MDEPKESLIDLLKRAKEDPVSLTDDERDLVLRAIAEFSMAVMTAMQQIGKSLGEALLPVAHVLSELEDARSALMTRSDADRG